MQYVYVVIDADNEVICAHTSERNACEFIYERQLEWPITERPEYFIEQVEYYV